MSETVAQKIERFGQPVKVSPFIRFCRWSFLIAGIAYGNAHWYSLKKKEDARRDYVAKMTPIWTAQRNAKKAELDKIEMAKLSKEVGSPI